MGLVILLMWLIEWDLHDWHGPYLALNTSTRNSSKIPHTELNEPYVARITVKHLIQDAQIPELNSFSSRLAVAFAQSIKAGV